MISDIDLFNNLSMYSHEDIEKIRKAFLLASSLHDGQVRKSGEPYIIHPVNVAYILTELKADADTVCAGLLHDTIEDTSITKSELSYYFNDTIAELVDGVTKMRRLDFDSKIEQNLANSRKIITGLMNDVRIIIVKLADRLHNMRTLEFMTQKKQTEISLETMKLFVPLANLVGLYWIKSELEDLSLLYLNKEKYMECAEIRHMQEVGFNYLLDEMCFYINKRLLDNGIDNEIDKKIKNIYGIYKQLESGKQLLEIHDLLSLKIIVNSIPNCYLTLGVVHDMYHPLDNRFKDYICKPKKNLYRSLHSTVFKDNRLIHTKIRTLEMDQVALYGLTANWNLNSSEARVEMKEYFKKYKEYKSLKEIDEMFSENDKFIEQVSSKLFADKIYVYTPIGDMVSLPVGSTPVDFAYYIHTDIGDSMKKAIVNDFEVPFNYELKTGDRIQIITKGLQSDFINSECVKTDRAKKKINKLGL